MTQVGQIKASPEVNISFGTLGTTAIQRSERGIVCLIVKDSKAKKKWTTLKTVADIDSKSWDTKTLNYFKLAMHYGAYKILVRNIGKDEDINSALASCVSRKMNWLAYPGATEVEDQAVVTWTKQVFLKDSAIAKTVKYVSSFADKSDFAAIVELANPGTYKSIYGDFTAQEYTSAIGGIIAGMALNRSGDNFVLNDLVDVEDFVPQKGKFSLYNDDGKIRVNYAVNSKTTFDSVWKKDTRKIKVVEGMCFLVDDIRDTFRNYWLGTYLNDYDNKSNFCSNVTKVYFKEMAPNVLNGDYDNKLEIDFEAQKSAVLADGLDPEEMSEGDIYRYPTGDDVYLTGDVRFVDTMANLNIFMLM